MPRTSHAPQALTRLLPCLLTAALLLGACGARATPLPTARPTFLPQPTFTATASPPPTATPTLPPTPTTTPTATPTRVPQMVGTSLPPARATIVEGNLDALSELARWGLGEVTGLAVSAGENGRAAVTTPLGLYLYDVRSLTLLTHLEGQVPAALPAFSPDGTQVAAAVTLPGAGGAQAVLVWQVISGELVETLPLAGRAIALRWSADGTRLAALSRLDDGTRRGASWRVWQGGNATPYVLSDTAEWIGGEAAEVGAIRDDLALAATHGAGAPVRLWRARDGVNFATTPETATNAAPMAFAPGGTPADGLLAVGYGDRVADFRNDNAIRLWRIAPDLSGVPLKALTLVDYRTRDGSYRAEGSNGSLIALDWSADGALIAAGHADRSLHVWAADAAAPTTAAYGTTRANALLIATRTLPAGVAFWSGDGTLLSGGLERYELPRGISPAAGGDFSSAQSIGYTNDFIPGLFDVALSPSGELMALAGFGQIELRDAQSGAVTGLLTGMSGKVNAVAFSPTGDTLAAACADGTARLFRLRDGAFLSLIGPPGAAVMAVTFSPNGRFIAVAGADMLIHLFRASDLSLIRSYTAPYVADGLRFAPNVDQLAARTTSGVTLRGFAGEINKITSTLQGTVGGVNLTDMAYSPGGEFLAIVGNGVARVIDPLTRADVYTLSLGGGNAPQPLAAAFSADNAFLAVGYGDGSLRIYWAADGSLLRTIDAAHPLGVTRLLFSADGRALYSVGGEGSVRVWGVRTEPQ